MKLFLIKIGDLNYGLCCSDSEQKVRNFYDNKFTLEYSILDITNLYDLPCMEISITNELKGIIK